MTGNDNQPIGLLGVSVRLISERTVEENILKKANQKRMLGDMAIDGGNFTTAFFKEVGVQPHNSGPAGGSFSLHINRDNNHLFGSYINGEQQYI